MFRALLLSTFLAACPIQAHAGNAPDLASLTATLSRAEAFAVSQLEGGDHWNMPLYMGSSYVSQYYLLRAWLGQTPGGSTRALEAFDEARFQKLLHETQLADGSWQQVADVNLTTGSLDATAMNYWALKVMGESQSSPSLARARNFILSHGGIEKTSAFSRILFALFGQLSWKSIPRVPLVLANPGNPRLLNLEQFPQWVRPHIVPIAYLRSQHVQRDLGPRYALPELHGTGLSAPTPERRPLFTLSHRWLANLMLSTQAERGSWGGYTSATLLTTAALDDYAKVSGDRAGLPAIEAAERRGLGFVDSLYVSPSNPNAYLGSVCDGRYWDSILLLQGLESANPASPAIFAAAAYLAKAQVANGGIPFGFEFEATPDLDDTAELITTLNLRGDSANSRKARTWLLSMQNSDGGWGAFDRNNNGNLFLKKMAGNLADSANLFDPATPDVTGHALEALGSSGFSVRNSTAVANAVRYLRANANPANGVWQGRWGVNYIYGTNAVVSGLLRVGVPAGDPLISQAVGWLKAHQNPDGGFGETTHSDLNVAEAGVGVSTPSQTAWGLMMLVRAGEARGAAAEAAAAYLLRTANPQGGWTDQSVVGTGHSGIVYLVYPSYSIAFPMIALAEYRRAL